MRRFLLPLGVFGLIVLFLGIGLKKDPQRIPSPLIGKPAPTFSLARLDAPEHTFSPRALYGQVWLLNVWASWCASCRQEHPLLLDLARQGGLPMVGLNYMDSTAEGAKWLSQNGNPYQLSVQDTDGKVGIDYGVYGVPETFLIDRHGIIRYKLSGPLTGDVIRMQILPLVEELKRG